LITAAWDGGGCVGLASWRADQRSRHHDIFIGMKRALIQFDGTTYSKLRQTAFDEKLSISAVGREMVDRAARVVSST
jgi:hypothetical protein